MCSTRHGILSGRTGLFPDARPGGRSRRRARHGPSGHRPAEDARTTVPRPRSDVRGPRRADRQRSNRRAARFPPSGQSPVTRAWPGAPGLMICVVHGPEPTRSAVAGRVLALVTLTFTLVGTPVGDARADACAYASTGPGGTDAVAVAGSHSWPTFPPCGKPSPKPPPPPTPTPAPTPPPPTPPPPKPSPPPPTPEPPSTPPAPKPEPPPPAPPRPAPARPAAPEPTPVPTPGPTQAPARERPSPPAPAPSATPTPRPSMTPVHYPRHRTARPPRRSPRGTTSPLVFVLLITVPAVVAVAALRAR